jgi:hypothetical protein
MDNRDGTVGTFLQLQDSQDGIVNTEPPRTRLSGKKARTGPGQDSQDRPGRKY